MLNKAPAHPAQFKADVSQRIVEGYASHFGNVDEVGDVVVKGAFERTLANRLPRKVIKTLYNHGPLIGSPISATEDSVGLFTVSKISNNPLATAVLQDIADGHVTHMSFAFDILRREHIQPEEPGKTAIRRLLELKLYEVSYVDFPANEMAAILGAKAISDALDEALGAVPQLAKLWETKGFFKDSQLDLHRHLTGVVASAITAAIKALSDESSEPPAIVPAVATTSADDPPPIADVEIPDPEDGLYDVAFKLSSLKARLDVATAGYRLGT